MKKIIVTGCNGQLGRAVNLFFKDNKDISFVNTDVGELDITNIEGYGAGQGGAALCHYQLRGTYRSGCL